MLKTNNLEVKCTHKFHISPKVGYNLNPCPSTTQPPQQCTLRKTNIVTGQLIETADESQIICGLWPCTDVICESVGWPVQPRHYSRLGSRPCMATCRGRQPIPAHHHCKPTCKSPRIGWTHFSGITCLRPDRSFRFLPGETRVVSLTMTETTFVMRNSFHTLYQRKETFIW